MKPLTWMRRIRGSGLPGPVILTGWAIALRADQHGNCWPSYQQIAEDTAADKRAVIRRVKALREAGWIMVANRVNGHGHQSNSYQLTTPPDLWKTQGGSDIQTTPLVTYRPPPSDIQTTPQGVTLRPPRREGVKEGSEPRPTPPVDNRHLTALIADLGRAARLP